jgi:hypothetical protein
VTRQAVFTLVALGFGGLLAAQPPAGDTKVQKVLDDWKARREAVRGIRYTLTGKYEEHGAKRAENLPARPPSKLTVLLDVTGKRFRQEKENHILSHAGDRYITRATTLAYDGKAHHASIPRAINELGPDNPNAVITKGNLTHQAVDSDVWPLLMAHGFVPTVERSPRPDRLPADYTTEDFDPPVAGEHEGVKCVVLKTGNAITTPPLRDALWIDPARASAVLRYVYYSGRNPFFRLDVEYQRTPHGWLPKAWTHAQYSGPRLASTTRWVVDRFEVEPATTPEDFTLPIPPNSVVWEVEYPEPGRGLDPHKPGTTKYVTDEFGRRKEVERTGFTTMEGVALPPEEPARWWRVGLGVLAVLAVGAMSLLVLQRAIRSRGDRL